MNTISAPRSHPAASITSAAAALFVQAALQAADAISIKVAVAVTDGAGNLKAFERQDGSPFLTADVAIDKAWSAASYGIATHVWTAHLTADPNVAQLAHRPRLVAVGGGYPLKEDGMVIGAVGVSGGTYRQDQEIAEAGLAALGLAAE